MKVGNLSTETTNSLVCGMLLNYTSFSRETNEGMKRFMA